VLHIKKASQITINQSTNQPINTIEITIIITPLLAYFLHSTLNSKTTINYS